MTPALIGTKINTDGCTAFGRTAPTSAAQTITIPGVQRVLAVVASLESDPVAATVMNVSAVPGLTANTFVLKTWKADSVTPATSWTSVTVNWVAICE